MSADALAKCLDAIVSLRPPAATEPVAHPCLPQEYVSADALAKCLDAIVSHCKDLAKTGCFGGWSGKLEEVRGRLQGASLCREEGQ